MIGGFGRGTTFLVPLLWDLGFWLDRTGVGHLEDIYRAVSN